MTGSGRFRRTRLGHLEDEGHKTRLAKDSDEAIRAIEERRPSLVILDIWLPRLKADGLEVLARRQEAAPSYRL